MNSYQFQDNLSWNKGRHSFKFGTNITYQRSPNFFLPNVNGSYSYATNPSAGVPGLPFANLALNTASSISVTRG